MYRLIDGVWRSFNMDKLVDSNGHPLLASVSVPRPSWPSHWVLLSLFVGGVILIVRVNWETTALEARVIRDLTLFLVVPLTLGVTYGRRIGWVLNRQALVDTILLAAFVAPFYVIGSSIPTIRTYYPMWSSSVAPESFVPHSIALLLLALATETYYRGLLCVGVREIGFKCVFISPVVYAMMHVSKPPIELLLSGPTDVLFGAVDYRSGSILPSVIAHGGGLILLDWLVLHDPILPPELVVRWLEWLPVPL